MLKFKNYPPQSPSDIELTGMALEILDGYRSDFGIAEDDDIFTTGSITVGHLIGSALVASMENDSSLSRQRIYDMGADIIPMDAPDRPDGNASIADIALKIGFKEGAVAELIHLGLEENPNQFPVPVAARLSVRAESTDAIL